MSIRGAALIAGAYEHPGRHLPDKSLAQIHGEVALGALKDAGLTLDDVDGYFCSADAVRALSMVDYLGLNPSYLESTDTGGSSYVLQVGHAAAAIATGKCRVVLVTMGGRPLSGPTREIDSVMVPESGFETVFGMNSAHMSYALAARRHMYEYGTTSVQLAAIKVAASTHAQHNPRAVRPNVVTVEEVLASPMVSDPLHRLDCCVTTDGGGAVVLVSPEVARELDRHCVRLLGHGEAAKHGQSGGIDLTYTAAVWSGPRAFEEAGVRPADIDYASIYDSFTITVLMQLEDLGFCEKGLGGRFVEEGALLSPSGRLPVNTDGGGLCNNHPDFRGGMCKLIEAVRQVRGEAHPAVQVPDCELALVQALGGSIGTRMVSGTLILGRQ